MTWSIVKLLGAEIWRWIAETIPEVTVLSSANGFPIATTGSPTVTLSELPSGSGGRVDAEAATLRTATSVDGSAPTTVASTGFSRSWGKVTEILLAPSTT